MSATDKQPVSIGAVAIFPGTFNPLHSGHLMIAEAAHRQFNLHKIYFILSPNPPHKGPASRFLPVEQRSALIEASISANQAFELDLRELKRLNQPSYTLQTVKEIKAELGLLEARLKVILGFDAFLSLGGWRGAKELAEECHFLVAPRPGWEQLDLMESLSDFHEELSWQLIDSPLLPISSSQIRLRKEQKLAYRYLMHDAAFQLYQSF